MFSKVAAALVSPLDYVYIDISFLDFLNANHDTSSHQFRQLEIVCNLTALIFNCSIQLFSIILLSFIEIFYVLYLMILKSVRVNIIEIIVTKGEIAHNEQYLQLPQ